MQLPAIRSLVENHTLEALAAAEALLLDGAPPGIEVPGADAGEQLTHVMAAAWVKQHIAETGADLTTALRAYTQRVRKSIS